MPVDESYPSRESDFGDYAHPPDGGWVKLALLGVALPIVIWYFAGKAWITEEATWIGSRQNMLVDGNAAKSIAVVYLSAGLFCHFRWCWGIIPVYRVFEIGTVVSLLGVIGGLGYSVYYLFFW